MTKFLKDKFSNEKDVIVIKNILASLIVKGGALVISFLSLPAYIRYFENQEILGVWFTILSVLTWILSFDFGIGNGLRNRLVGAIVRNDKLEIRRYISSAYFVIGLIVIIGICIGLIFIPLIDWNLFFNISTSLISKKTIIFVVVCVFLTIMVQFLLRLITFVLYALQKSALNNFLALITSTSQLLFVLFFPSYNTEINLRILSVIYFLCVVLPLLFASIYVYSNELKGCSPSLKYYNKSAGKGIIYLGGVFFWNQIMYMIITGSNSIFITKFIGPAKVIDYQIYYRLFSAAGMLFTLALTPLWSAITKAFEENDKEWINKYFRLINKLVLLVVICEFILVPMLQPIINIWLGSSAIRIDYPSAIIFALFGSIFIYQTVLSTFACGIGKMRLQLVFYTVGVVLKYILISFILPKHPNWIIVVLSDIIILLPYCLFEWISLRKRFT